jgi:type I restriction enzyme, S subunit
VNTTLPESWREAQLGKLVDTIGGGTPSRKRPEFFGGSIPWLTGFDVPEDAVTEIAEGRERITEDAVRASATHVVEPGTVLVTTRVTVGKAAIASAPLCFSQDMTGLKIRAAATLSPEFLAWFIVANRAQLTARNQGSTIVGVTRDALATMSISLPPLSEQHRIVMMLREAEEIRSLHVRAERKVAEVIPSLFYEMFGDPLSNSKKWPTATLRSLAKKISDGPFGSNLKTSHYTESGVRVVRLQNIGIGEFHDENRAFISEEHFATLNKHECVPGDVLIGTLGDPNLRACILPHSITRALNKADCVQFRPNPSHAIPEYICWLLNMPATLRLAAGRIEGQTRARISMGRLADLAVPVPPLHLQARFGEIVREADMMRVSLMASVDQHLRAAVRTRAFTGELTVQWRRRHEPKLRAEARDRDNALRTGGVSIQRRATIQEIEEIFTERTDGSFAELSAEQLRLIHALGQRWSEDATTRLFTAASAADDLGDKLALSPDAMRRHLDVLAARGLLLCLTRQRQRNEATEFATLYRAPHRALTAEDEPQSDHRRDEELERLAAKLGAKTALPPTVEAGQE